MNLSFFNTLVNEKYGVLGLFTALLIVVVVFLFKQYQRKSDQLDAEKDKEIADAKEMVAKVTLVMEEQDNTMKSILIYLEKDAKS